MGITLAFDIYGTLLDTNGIKVALKAIAGSQAAEFSRLWRDKQLEYSFRRGLMQNYRDFSICTSQALEYACLFYRIKLSEDEKEKLMGEYRTLPLFPDVKEGLESLKSSEFRMYAFSNGRSDMVDDLLKNTGIRGYFIDVISVDELKSYKPNPEVYSHFMRRANSVCAESWLVSGNSFDVIGAISSGMRAIWIQRTPDEIFDPWEIKPTFIINSLLQLSEKIRSLRK